VGLATARHTVIDSVSCLFGTTFYRSGCLVGVEESLVIVCSKWHLAEVWVIRGCRCGWGVSGTWL